MQNILFVGLLVIVGPQFLFLSLRVLKNLKRRQNGTSIFFFTFVHSSSIFASYTCWRCYFFFSDPVYKVRCSSQEMTVELVKPYDVKHIYLEHLKHYPGINSHEKLKILKMSMFHHTTVYQRSIFCPKTTNSWKAWKLVNFYFCVGEVFEKFEFSRLVKNCPFIWAIFGQNRDFWSESFNI